jgi:hypothetical protein
LSGLPSAEHRALRALLYLSGNTAMNDKKSIFSKFDQNTQGQ